VEMHDVDVAWEEPHASTWQSGLVIDDVDNLLLDGSEIDAVPGSSQPVMSLNNANGVVIRNSRIATVHVKGGTSKGIRLIESDADVTRDPEAAPIKVQ